MQRLLLLFFILAFCYTRSSGAERESETYSKFVADTNIISRVSGKVLGPEGEGLIGVAVMVKGTKKGTSTDSMGVFHLSDVKQYAGLVFSYLGYDKKELLVGSGKFFTVKLIRSENRLDETVVMAYGITTKRNNTGNISSVSAADIAKQPVSNPLLALQGRVPGMVITPATGNAGSGVRVNIQGTTSISFTGTMNDPLYVIDGIPYSSQLLPNLGGILGPSGTQFSQGQYGSPLSFINPADIERIDVLKDADATSIYGSRAANGAILITTKKGAVGNMKVDADFQTGWSKLVSRLDMLNTKDYLMIRNEAFANMGGKPSADPTNRYYAPDLLVWDTTRNTNWQKELLGKSASSSRASVSIRGGNTNANYLASITYNNQGSIFTSLYGGPNVDKSATGHLSVNNSSKNGHFRSTIGVSYTFDVNKLPGADFTSDAIFLPPDAPPMFNSDGTLNYGIYGGRQIFNNPLVKAYQVYKVKTSNLLTSMNLEYDFAKYFTFKTTLGYNMMQANDLVYAPSLIVPPANRLTFRGSEKTTNNQSNNWSVEPQLVFAKKIGPGAFTALVGASIQQSNTDGMQLNATGFATDLALKDIAQATSWAVTSHTIATYKYAAAFGRLNYIFKDKYIINLGARRDGSSRFGEANRFHNFGSAALAWIFSDESWFKEHIGIFTYAKLRASYGTTGNDQIGDYAYYSQYLIQGISNPYQGGQMMYIYNLANPYLQWETTKKMSFGLDGAMLNNRISFNVSYNQNRTSNQLNTYALPTTTGFTGITSNFPGLVQNSAFECAISSINIKQNAFKWSTNLNFTVANNKLIRFPGLDSSSYANLYEIGKPITIIRAFKYAGVNPQTGYYEVYDKNGKVTADPQIEDMTQLINTAPKFYGGIQNSFTYKNFQLDFFFQYTVQTGQNVGILGGYATPGIKVNMPTDVLSRWRQKGDVAPVQRVEALATNAGLPYSNASNSDHAYVSANFLRLKNASLSYNFRLGEGKSGDQKNLKVYILAQNIWTFTNYSGLDPEIPNTTSLPSLLSIMVGAHLTL